MKFIILIIFILISNCSPNKVVNHHGVHFLEKKNKKLIVNNTNKNDILKLLGNPSTKSTFDNDVWIYIERKKVTGSIWKFGKKRLETNNVLILEIDSQGLLAKKELLTKKDMNDLVFTDESTKGVYSKRSFVYDFLSSMRQKINDPLGKRAKSNQQ